jgi:hypothetical protein
MSVQGCANHAEMRSAWKRDGSAKISSRKRENMKYRISYSFEAGAPTGCKYQAHVYGSDGTLAFIRCRDSFTEARDAAVQALHEQTQAPTPPPDEEVEL